MVDASPNGAGWFNTPVTVSFPASDALSGLAEVAADQYVAAEGAGQEVIGTATDAAGNLASAAAILDIDLTPPGITIAAPADGAAYLLNAVVPAGYGCADALSGVAFCVGTVPNGAALDTATAGPNELTVHAADVAGRAAIRTHGYAVRYAFSGFRPPVTGDPMGTSAHAGRTVPVKYALSDASGAAITDLASFVSLASSPAACEGGEPAGGWEPAAGAGQTMLRYEESEDEDELGHFIFNWRTEPSWRASCRMLRLELNDGTEHFALFRFR
jgi:hypothetical protein